MQDERSQLQNRARAMQVLRARLLKARQDEQAALMGDARRAQVHSGNRSEKIRTYNFKENRLTDHRIGFTIYQLQDVLAGNLDTVVDALQTDERTRLLAGSESD
jgi:peptide chain release factor 1